MLGFLLFCEEFNVDSLSYCTIGLYELKNDSLCSSLVDFGSPIAFIPSLAIHLDRGANDGRKINQQKELPPVILKESPGNSFSFEDSLLRLIKKQPTFRMAQKLQLLCVQIVGLKIQLFTKKVVKPVPHVASVHADNLLKRKGIK